MTRRSIVEYAVAVRGRYFWAAKKAKTEILNEFGGYDGHAAKDRGKVTESGGAVGG